MGNFNQHVLWSLTLLVIIESIAIYYLLGDYLFTIIIFPLFFVWGSIMPDVDLPRDKWWRNVLFNVMFPIGGYIIGKKATHWGRVHSLGFGMVLCIIQYLFLGFITVDNWDTVTILTFAFWCGYVFHLIIDQAYHTWRKKGGKRKALKLWSNNWWI